MSLQQMQIIFKEKIRFSCYCKNEIPSMGLHRESLVRYNEHYHKLSFTASKCYNIKPDSVRADPQEMQNNSTWICICMKTRSNLGTTGDGKEQGSLGCCSSWSHKSWTQLSKWTTARSRQQILLGSFISHMQDLKKNCEMKITISSKNMEGTYFMYIIKGLSIDFDSQQWKWRGLNRTIP